MVLFKLSMVLTMLSEVLAMMPNSTSEGSSCCSSGSMSITFWEMLTELAPDCFCTMIMAPRWPLL